MKHRVVQKCNSIDPIKLWKLNEPTDYVEVKKSKIDQLITEKLCMI